MKEGSRRLALAAVATVTVGLSGCGGEAPQPAPTGKADSSPSASLAQSPGKLDASPISPIPFKVQRPPTIDWRQYPTVDANAVCVYGGEAAGDPNADSSDPDTWKNDILIRPDQTDAAAKPGQFGVIFGPGRKAGRYTPEGRLLEEDGRVGELPKNGIVSADRGDIATCYTVFSFNEGQLQLVKSTVSRGTPPQGTPRI